MALRRVGAGPPSGMVVVSRSNKPIRRGLVVLAPKVYHWGRSRSSEPICPESISRSSVVEKLENRARILVQVTIYRRLQIQTSYNPKPTIYRNLYENTSRPIRCLRYIVTCTKIRALWQDQRSLSSFSELFCTGFPGEFSRGCWPILAIYKYVSIEAARLTYIDSVYQLCNR